MTVEVVNITSGRVQQSLIKRAALATLDHFREKRTVTVAVVGEKRIRELNRVYRQKDYPTDVLSFVEAEAEASDPSTLGEVVINYKQVKKQAAAYGHGLRYELAFIVIHGVLHLLGYEDETKKGVTTMEELGYKIVKKLKL